MHVKGGRKLIWVAAFPLIPGYSATSAKSCGILLGLSGRFDITVLVNAGSYGEEDCRSELEPFWGKSPPVSLRVIGSRPELWRLSGPMRLKFLNEAVLNLARIRAEIRHLAGDTQTPVVLDDAVLSRMLGTISQPVLHSPHDCLSRLYWSEVVNAESFRTRLQFFYRYLVVSIYERRMYHLARSVHLVNSDDAALLMARNSRVKVFLCPIASLLPYAARLDESHRDIELLIWGNFASGPVWQGAIRAIEALKHCKWRKRNVVVLGRAASRLPSAPVQVIERVENLVGFLRRVRVCVLPDYDGAGIKNRALDALSQGACLVGIRSQLGGLPTPLTYCVATETIEGAIDAAMAALDDGSYRVLGAAGLAVFREQLTPTAIADRFEDHLESHYSLCD